MNRMASLNKPVDNRVVVVIFIVLICVFLLGLTFYTIKLTYDINDTINEKTATALDLKEQVARLRSIQAKDAQMESIVQQAQKKIPPLPDEAGIIEFIKSITGDGVITGISFNDRKNLGSSVEMPITITITSSYGEMLDLLIALASAERYYTVSSISINRTADGNVSYIINASAYYNPNAAYSG